ncbi:MAG: putative DNA-binding domain-containing protein [Myxococcota bacterium]
MQRALESCLADLVFGPTLDASGSLQAWLTAHDVEPEDAHAIEAELEQLLVYRELIRGTLRAALERAIPRSMSRLGTHFDVFFDRFLNERGPRTHYLRDVTGELLEFVASLPSDPRVPGYWLDLARHEALHIEVAATPVTKPTRAGAELALEAGLDFSESVRLVRYDYAVHALPHDVADRSEPACEPTHILAYRDADHDVRYLRLSEFAAAVLRRLHAGQALGDSLRGAAAEIRCDLDASTLEAVAALLADLSERGVITGACAARLPGSADANNPATLGPAGDGPSSSHPTNPP